MASNQKPAGGKAPALPQGAIKPRTVIEVMSYNSKDLIETQIGEAPRCSEFLGGKGVTWINVIGLKDAVLLESLGSCFGLHPLVMDDIMHTRQRPKLEGYDDYVYLVARMLSMGAAKEIKSEQISIIISRNYVISFQENEGDVFGRVREAIRKSKGRIRGMGSDFLAYSLLDAIVDNYFSVMEALGESVEQVESGLTESPGNAMLLRMRRLRKELLIVRRAVWPMREVLLDLDRESMGGRKPLITHDTGLYLRDVYDHTVQLVDTIETYRDMMSGMMDIYLSSMSNRMNEVMKVLTIIGTIFIPLTFVTGIYGMNFDYMPELSHPLGYFGTLALMAAVAVGMLVFFRRKKWI